METKEEGNVQEPEKKEEKGVQFLRETFFNKESLRIIVMVMLLYFLYVDINIRGAQAEQQFILFAKEQCPCPQLQYYHRMEYLGLNAGYYESANVTERLEESMSHATAITTE